MAKVKDVIRDLSSYDPNADILVAWWSKDFVQDLAGDSIELTDNDVTSLLECEYDWASINEQIDYEIGEIIKLREADELAKLSDQELWDTETENTSDNSTITTNTNA